MIQDTDVRHTSSSSRCNHAYIRYSSFSIRLFETLLLLLHTYEYIYPARSLAHPVTLCHTIEAAHSSRGDEGNGYHLLCVVAEEGEGLVGRVARAPTTGVEKPLDIYIYMYVARFRMRPGQKTEQAVLLIPHIYMYARPYYSIPGTSTYLLVQVQPIGDKSRPLTKASNFK